MDCSGLLTVSCRQAGAAGCAALCELQRTGARRLGFPHAMPGHTVKGIHPMENTVIIVNVL